MILTVTANPAVDVAYFVEKFNMGEVLLLFKDKTILKVICVFVLWNVASYITISYMGAYQVNDLGFSPVYASVIIIVGSLARAIVSRPVGKLADKFSFCKMLYLCFSVEVVAFLCAMLITPANGSYMYLVYYIIYCIGCSGINSSIINLIYDYVDFHKRTSALALVNTASGFAGFFATLAVSPLVKHIQEGGNNLFGIKIYAQQLLALCSAIVVVCIIVYLLLVISKLKKHKN